MGGVSTHKITENSLEMFQNADCLFQVRAGPQGLIVLWYWFKMKNRFQERRRCRDSKEVGPGKASLISIPGPQGHPVTSPSLGWITDHRGRGSSWDPPCHLRRSHSRGGTGESHGGGCHGGGDFPGEWGPWPSSAAPDIVSSSREKGQKPGCTEHGGWRYHLRRVTYISWDSESMTQKY